MTEEITPINFASLSKLVINDLNEMNQLGKSSLNIKYSKDQIVKFLLEPKKFQKELRKLSNYLYNSSPNYKRLVQYFSSLLTFDFIIEPYDLNLEKVNVDAFKKQYQKNVNLLENMNIPHEFLKVLRTAFKEDIFYGYEHSTDESYFIQKLDPDYCQIKSIEDGVYNFAFDFSIFDSDEDLLKKYPQEFINKHKIYKNDKKNNRWLELDSKKTICIKINEEIEYPIPPFNVVFEAVFDIDDQKRMRKVQTKMDNYMILTQQIPIDEKNGEANKFLIDLDTAISFHNKATQSLPEEVGLVTSPMKIEAIKLERKNKDTDRVAEAERDYYNAAGVSQTLFNSDKMTSTGVSKSVTTDEQIVFDVLRQLERWINRKLKNFNKTYKFRAKFLNNTIFNIKEVQERYLKAAQFGFPVKSALASSLGLSPSGLSNMTFLENDILGLHERMIPLSSAHTQSGDEAGAPKKSDNEISDSGLKTRDNDGNIRN